jgi:siroheme decarboxylase
MAESLTNTEKRVITALSAGLAPVSRPYLAASTLAGCGEAELIATLKSFVERGIVRKVAAVVDSRSLGIDGGALVAWRVSDDAIERVGAALAASPRVTHCYARIASQEWPYSLYTMTHGADDKSVADWASTAAKSVGVADYVVLVTREELKKTAPKYRFDEVEE